MIYLDLFLGFLKVGCFAFGGAYGAIPLIRDVVLSYQWMNDEMLTYMIAVSESTPGPIMVNLATYVGSQQGGLLGALLATLAVVLPSFIIILVITAIMNHALKNRNIQAILRGLKPCVIGIVLATGIYMVISNCFSKGLNIDLQAFITTTLCLTMILGYKKLFNKTCSPIMIIMISAILGMIIYGI